MKTCFPKRNIKHTILKRYGIFFQRKLKLVVGKVISSQAKFPNHSLLVGEVISVQTNATT
jgi:hypothetical protein